MTDRELLELAARAAGYQIRWSDLNGCFLRSIDGNWIDVLEWSSLDDDGDAFRLAAKLNIDVVHANDLDSDDESRWETIEASNQEEYCAVEHVYDDILRATRRAITRAAAEIGKAL